MQRLLAIRSTLPLDCGFDFLDSAKAASRLLAILHDQILQCIGIQLPFIDF